MLRNGLAALAVLAGCDRVFGIELLDDAPMTDPGACVTNERCVRGVAQGECECGYCSYPEATCPVTNRRWQDDAGGGLGGTCVARPIQISAKVYHTCATMTDDTAWCWGYQDAGQLGASQPIGVNSNLPIQVRTSEGVVIGDVAETRTGVSSTCARRTDGSVICWGGNSFGQLGAKHEESTSRDPVTVVTAAGPLSDVRLLSLGFLHACAVTSVVGKADELYCWGLGTSGQLGNGTLLTSNLAVRVDLPTGFPTIKAVTTAGEHTCAILRNLSGSQTYCWGRTAGGRLGDGTLADTTIATPRQVTWLPGGGVMPIPDLVRISGGNRHTCAMKFPPGELYCWGDNAEGGLGDNTQQSRPVATRVALTGMPDLVAAGDTHSCSNVAGDLHCWGSDDLGQLGNGPESSTSQLTPVLIATGNPLSDLTAGFQYTCALGTDRRLRCWGGNEHGELGDGTTEIRHVPTEIPPAAFCPSAE